MMIFIDTLCRSPFERWQIDFTWIRGIPFPTLIVIDCFTKTVWYKHLPSKQASGVTAFLLSTIRKENHAPNEWHTDNGGEFISLIMNEIAATLRIKIIHGRPYHPQSQGQ